MATDLAQSLISGYQAGAHIAQERRRIQAEEARTQAEANARAVTAQREATMEQQRIRIESARQQAEAGLRKQALAQAEQVNQAKTAAAAQKFAAVQGLAKDLAAGVPMAQALYRNPGASSPSDMIAAQRAAETLANQTEQMKLRKAEFAERQKQNEFTRNKTAKVSEPTVSIPLPKSETGDPTGTFHGTLGAAQRQFGTNLPPILAAPQAAGTGTAGKKRFRWDPKKQDLVDVMAATAEQPAEAPAPTGSDTPPD